MESTIYPNVIPIQNKQLPFANTPSGAGGGATLDLDQYSTNPKMIILSIVSKGWGDVNQNMYIDAIMPISHDGGEEASAVVPGYLINSVDRTKISTIMFKISYDDQENKLKISLSDPQPPQSFKDVVANAMVIE